MPERAQQLTRTAFRTSRQLDFCSRKELIAQTGHEPDVWPLVVLKELVDNALDACEEADIAPELAVSVDGSGITVTDNGPGLPPDFIADILDFNIRVSSREAYVSPSRGAQGNALKTLVAMPFVLDGKAGQVEIDSFGVGHMITFSADPIRQHPIVEHTRSTGLVQNGTRVTVRWPAIASSELHAVGRRFVHLTDDYVWLNPHVKLKLWWFGELATSAEPSNIGWSKWRPSDPTSPHWYTPRHLERLIAGYIAHDEDTGRERTVREFISEFRGLSRTAKQKAVLDATGLSGERLSSLRNGTDLDHPRVGLFLHRMKAESAELKPELLGVIGREHLATRFNNIGCEIESFRYKRCTGILYSAPWVLEVAFGWCPEASDRRLVTGVNWSPSIINPFRQIGGHGGLDGILSRQHTDWDEPVALFVHLASARVEYTDRGKSAIVSVEQLPIIEAVQEVTKTWRKQRIAELKEHDAVIRRRYAMTRTRKVSQKEAAGEIMERAYLKASANGQLPAKARQIMYAARPHILARTGIEKLVGPYFTQALLPDFIAENPELTADWKVIFDARGHLIEPHTGRSVPLGTSEVESYLYRIGDPAWGTPTADLPDIETCGPSGCYGAVLFCEKEGFNELFAAVQLAERYDIAIMSTKGLSVVASRRLVDSICADYQIPLFVMHDFDVSGFTILNTLRSDNRRYTFENEIQVIDLGLRLDDVTELGLESEPVSTGDEGKLRDRLERDGATPEEINFLLTRRVELNAFTSDKLVEWIEEKLDQHGVRKVIPGDHLLTEAYRRELQSAWLRDRFDELLEASCKAVEGLDIPTDLPYSTKTSK